MMVDGQHIGRRRMALARKLLKEGEIHLVGSVKERSPRDIDVICIVEDAIFSKHFLHPYTFVEEGRSGNWSEGRLRWSDTSIICSRILQERLGTHTMVDLKLLPRSLSNYGQHELKIEEE